MNIIRTMNTFSELRILLNFMLLQIIRVLCSFLHSLFMQNSRVFRVLHFVEPIICLQSLAFQPTTGRHLRRIPPHLLGSSLELRQLQGLPHKFEMFIFLLSYMLLIERAVCTTARYIKPEHGLDPYSPRFPQCCLKVVPLYPVLYRAPKISDAILTSDNGWVCLPSTCFKFSCIICHHFLRRNGHPLTRL